MAQTSPKSSAKILAEIKNEKNGLRSFQIAGCCQVDFIGIVSIRQPVASQVLRQTKSERRYKKISSLATIYW